MNGIRAVTQGRVRKIGLHELSTTELLRIVVAIKTATGTELVVVHYTGEDAASLSRDIQLGSLIAVRGKLHLERWDSPQGPRCGAKVIANAVKLLSTTPSPKDPRPQWSDEGRPVTPARQRALREHAPSAAMAAIPVQDNQ